MFDFTTWFRRILLMSLILRSIGPVRAAADLLAAAAFQLLIECSRALSQAWTERMLDYLTSGKEPVKPSSPNE
jgi:hypothetical protein